MPELAPATSPPTSATLEAVLSTVSARDGLEWPSLGTATFIVRAIARALATTPARRPLSPESIALDVSGAVWLIPAAPGAPPATSPPTAARRSMRAMAYSSPEAIDDQGVDVSSDVFSLGSIFFELLARRPPFLRETDLETLRAIQSEPAPALPTHVPIELARWVERCLARNKADRPAPIELAEALGRLSESLPTARPSRVADLVRRTLSAAESPRGSQGPARREEDAFGADTAPTGVPALEPAAQDPLLKDDARDTGTDGWVAAAPESEGPRAWPVWAERRFEIIGKLGAGGMGEVYRVLDRELDEVVALKLIPKESTSELRSTERLRREVRLARKIASPHVCRIFDIIDLGDGVRGLTMALVEGTTLAELMRLGVPVDYARFARWGADIAEGLAAAHEISIIHRDLKPENVIIQPDDRAVILDFGIALSAESEGSNLKLTQQGMIMGTPLYMSPEQLCNVPLDGRSDLFALGLILAELITAEVPMRGASYAELVERRVTRVVPYVLNDVDPGAPRELASIVDELLRTTVTLRPKSGREVAARLRVAAGAEPARREAPSPSSQVEPPSPRPEAPRLAEGGSQKEVKEDTAARPPLTGASAHAPRPENDRRWFTITTFALVAATLVLVVVSAVFGSRRVARDLEPAVGEDLRALRPLPDPAPPRAVRTATSTRAPNELGAHRPDAGPPRREAPRRRVLAPAEPM